MARIFDRVMAEPWLRDEIVQKFRSVAAQATSVSAPLVSSTPAKRPSSSAVVKPSARSTPEPTF